ncbi:MAG: hypothetical protein A2145_06275 [candidate division Zixibacteria bacterium RBG_16_40_9]|nr:MAG: hypothetical protein A2145_06275 [candidate division Zixibacteria bacterium RBG_16_40_9]
MQLKNFNSLEERLNKLVASLEKLNNKNKQISQGQAEVSSKVSEYQKERQNLTQELEKIKLAKNKAENQYKNQKGQIKRRIESLLSKLEVLEK